MNIQGSRPCSALRYATSTSSVATQDERLFSRLNIDPRRDRLQLADALLEVRDIDARRGGDGGRAVPGDGAAAAMAGQVQLGTLERQPAVPALEPGKGDDADPAGD